MSDNISGADAQLAVLTVVPILLVAFVAAAAIYGRQQGERVALLRTVPWRLWRRARVMGFIGRSLLALVAPLVCLYAEIALLSEEINQRVSTGLMWLALWSAAAVGLAAVTTGLNDVLSLTFPPAGKPLQQSARRRLAMEARLARTPPRAGSPARRSRL